MNIYKLMEFAKEHLPLSIIDDWQWNDRSFQFVVLDKRGNASDPYRFIYQPDEDFYGPAEDQVLGWIEELRFLSRLP